MEKIFKIIKKCLPIIAIGIMIVILYITDKNLFNIYITLHTEKIDRIILFASFFIVLGLNILSIEISRIKNIKGFIKLIFQVIVQTEFAILLWFCIDIFISYL